MFERFTDRARRIVVLAQDEARLLNHNYIGTEHLLLGLIREGAGVAARALEALGISPEVVRQRVGELTSPGEGQPQGHIPFTARAKNVLELALREAHLLGHNYIGTEHILLGLVREEEGVAGRVLAGLGADLNRTRQQVIEILQGYQGRQDFPGRLPGGLRRGRMPPDVAGRLHALEARLTAVEQRAETGPATGLADQVQRLRAEVERLRDLLRRRGIDPGDHAAGEEPPE